MTMSEVCAAKFVSSLSLAGKEYFFLDASKHPAKMAFDEQTKELVIYCSKTRAVKRTPQANLVFYEVASEQPGFKAPAKDSGEKLIKAKA